MLCHERKVIKTLEALIFSSCLDMHGNREKISIKTKISLVQTASLTILADILMQSENFSRNLVGLRLTQEKHYFSFHSVPGHK